VIGALVDIPAPGAEGVLFAFGPRFGGHALYVKDNRLHYVNNFVGTEQRVVGAEDIPAGHNLILTASFDKESLEADHATGIVSLYHADRKVGEARIKTQLDCPQPIGIGGDPEDVHVTATDFHDEHAVQPLQGHRAVYVEEVGGEHRRCLGVQEQQPGRVGLAFRRRGNLQGLEDPADRRCADPVAEFEQLALDPLVSPAAVLGGELLDQRGDLGADRRPSCLVRVGPLPGDQAAVPPQDSAGGDHAMRPQSSRQEPDQRGEDCAVGPIQLGPGVGAAQHGDLVPQYQELSVLGSRRPAEQDQPAADPDEDEVEQADRHE
jgi:hypothetical protein